MSAAEGVTKSAKMVACMSLCVFIEAEAKLWPHLWAGGNDPGVQTASQEEETTR